MGFLVVIVAVHTAAMNAENSHTTADVVPMNRDYLFVIQKKPISFLFYYISVWLKKIFLLKAEEYESTKKHE